MTHKFCLSTTSFAGFVRVLSLVCVSGIVIAALPAYAEDGNWMGGGGLKIPANTARPQRAARSQQRMAYATPAPQPSRGLFDFMFGGSQPAPAPVQRAHRSKHSTHRHGSRLAKPAVAKTIAPTDSLPTASATAPGAAQSAAQSAANSGPVVVTISATPQGSGAQSSAPQGSAPQAATIRPATLDTGAVKQPGYAKGVPINPLD